MISATLVRGYARAQALNSKEWPKAVKARFIEPGLVHYEELGTILVRRQFINKIAQSFVGKPVIDEQHKDARPENFKDVADGVVFRVWTDPADGWDWCEFLVWDEQTLAHCKDPNFFVSCAYTPTKIDQKGGKHNNLDYDGEFLDGYYTHLAIVRDPRYEGARIVLNSKGGTGMFGIFSKKKEEVDPKTTFIQVGEKEMTLEEVVNALTPPKKRMLGDDEIVVVNGKEYTGSELRQVLNKKKAKNEKKEHDHDEEENCGEGCPAYNSEGEKGEKAGDQEDAKKKEKEQGRKEAKNALKAAQALGLPKEQELAVVNSLAEKHADFPEVFEEALNELEAPDPDKKKEPGRHMTEFARTAEMRNNEPGTPTISTMQDRIALGNSRYGSKKEAK